jgi:hypothetical protein
MKGSTLQNISESEESFLKKFKYYEIITKPFKIIKNFHGVSPCRHEINNKLTNSRIKCQIFNIDKLAVRKSNIKIFDNFSKNLNKTGPIDDKINKEFSIQKEYLDYLKHKLKINLEADLMNIESPININTTNSNIGSLSSQITNILNPCTNTLDMALYSQIMHFENLINFSSLFGNSIFKFKNNSN